MMERRVGLFFFVLLAASWACDARQLGDQLSVMEISKQEGENESQASEKVARNDNVCTLCVEFATNAINCLSENKTQTEILDILHETCCRVPSFKQQCISLVDYYAPLFFLEIATVQPEDFCQKVNLCQKIAAFSSQLKEDSCGICQRTVSEIIVKLKDPDTQLEILELLLKACNSVENYVQKCKKMVFEYAPLILTNAEQFLEKTDVCTILHACQSPPAEAVTVLADS